MGRTLMFVRTFFGARIVAATSLVAVTALAACSTPGATPGGPISNGAPPMPSQSLPAAAIVSIAPRTSQLTIDCDAFARQPKATAHVHLVSGDVLAVTLCSNPSTGFSWQQPEIAGDALSLSGVSTGVPGPGAAGASNTTLVAQGPGEPVGAANTTTFLLTAEQAGTATVTLSYSRPWTGGEKGVWESTIDVTID
jgi:predicted secreted protein